jgi:hypothetical protein
MYLKKNVRELNALARIFDSQAESKAVLIKAALKPPLKLISPQ